MAKTAAYLGQHFLRSQKVIKDMVDAGKVASGETVLEIGPGEGVLTREILSRGARVVAIEKDRELVAKLRETFRDEIENDTLRLVTDDIRSANLAELMPKSYKVIANIPYYVTGDIIRTLLTATKQPTQAVLLIQKEVAERIVTRDHKQSILSLSVHAYGTPRIVRNVPRGAFHPMPQVDSAIISIENISRDFFDTISEQDFFRTVRAGFAEKRKMLRNNLSEFGDEETLRAASEACGTPLTQRAENVPLEAWKCLTGHLCSS